MLNNKEAGMVEPDEETLKCIKNIKEYKTLAEKIEQIGFETQTLFTKVFIGEITKKYDESKLDQLFGNIWYYMNYLRTLVTDCKNIENLINSHSELIMLLNENEDVNEQYILFTNFAQNNKFQSIKGNNFLESFSEVYFNNINTFTINNFNEICSNTKESLKNNVNIENTNLYKLLKVIENEELIIWSGKDFNFMTSAKSFNELIENIKMMLNEEKYGINIHYKKGE